MGIFAGQNMKMKRQVHMHIEGVPNPNAMKFVLENGILADEAYEFCDYAQAEASPLARKLLMLRYVERVLIHDNFVTVLKFPQTPPSWDELLYEVKMLIQQHLEDNEPILYLGAQALKHQRSDELVAEIATNLLNHRIRPAAQEDGGDILFEGFRDGVLSLSMHGSCHGCPYMSETLSKGVEPLLMGALPEIKQVVIKK